MSPSFGENSGYSETLSRIADPEVKQELTRILSLKIKAYQVADTQRREKEEIQNDPFAEKTNPSKKLLDSTDLDLLQDLDSAFGKFDIDFGDEIIILKRIFETCALAGLRINELLEETITIDENGGETVATKQIREVPKTFDIKKIVRFLFQRIEKFPIKGLLSKQFDGFRSDPPSSVLAGRQTINDTVDKENLVTKKGTLLEMIREFRIGMEKTLNQYGVEVL